MAEVKIDFDADFLVDVLTLEGVDGAVSGVESKYLAGHDVKVTVNLYDDEIVDDLIEALTKHKAEREVARLKHEVERAARKHHESLSRKDAAWAAAREVERQTIEAYQAVLDAQKALEKALGQS